MAALTSAVGTSWCPDAFLEAIPKTDLHVHLDGSLRLSTLIELAQADNIELPGYTEEAMREAVFRDGYKDLPEYLEGFKYTVAVMRSEKNIERIAYEFGTCTRQ
jgi:adenosine deaminase